MIWVDKNVYDRKYRKSIENALTFSLSRILFWSNSNNFTDKFTRLTISQIHPLEKRVGQAKDNRKAYWLQSRLLTVAVETLPEVATFFCIGQQFWLFSGLIIGLSVALAFSICSSIALAVLAAHLYHQRNNTEPREDNKKESSVRHYYAENYYDSVEWLFIHL